MHEGHYRVPLRRLLFLCRSCGLRKLRYMLENGNLFARGSASRIALLIWDELPDDIRILVERARGDHLDYALGTFPIEKDEQGREWLSFS